MASCRVGLLVDRAYDMLSSTIRDVVEEQEAALFASVLRPLTFHPATHCIHRSL